MDITFYMFFSAFLMSMSAWCVFLWAVRTGQFRDVEETKFQIWPKEAMRPDEAEGGPDAPKQPATSMTQPAATLRH